MENVKKKYEKFLLSKPNVIGVGIGYKYIQGRKTDEKAIVVFVEKKLPKAHLKQEELIPESLEGIKTDVREKRFLAFTTPPEEKQKRWRPSKGGVSIGHYRVTSGTLGTLVKDKGDGEIVILSNNHVLANSNDAQIGDPIVQPGTYYGGKVDTDTIAHLKRFVPIKFEQTSTCPIAKLWSGVYNGLAKLFGAKTRLVAVVTEDYNLVDCAIASPVSQSDVVNEIIDIGTPKGSIEPELGMQVRKSGSTSCYTEGEIDTTQLTVRVGYGLGKTALFQDQIGIQPKEGKFSAPGDSGSAIVDNNLNLVGLLFAGDESGYTIANKFSNVANLLEVDVIEQTANT